MEASKRIVLQNLVLTLTEIKLIHVNLAIIIFELKLIVFDPKDVLDKRQVFPRVIKHHLDVLFTVE